MHAGNQQSQQTADWRDAEVQQNEETPLEGVKHGIKHQHDYQHGQRNYQCQATVSPLLALVFACPVQRVSLWQLRLAIHLRYHLLDSATQVTAPHTVLDGDIALVAFPI